MQLKCVKCDKEAEYLVNGTRLCKDHYKPKPTVKQEPPQFGNLSFGMPGVSI